MVSTVKVPAGQTARTALPGDFILTHGDHWTSKMIRWGQKREWTGEREKYASWNHAALVVDYGATVAEALSQGVVASSLSKYQDRDYTLVRVEMPDTDRSQVLRFANSVLDARWRYSYTTIAQLALTLALRSGGQQWTIGKVGTAICSGFVSEALVRAGFIWPVPPAFMMPAHLAEYFDAPAWSSDPATQ